jgi:hypothetical protein
MSSESSPLPHNDENESIVVSTKPKRLPRSAKKRLRYERIRQQRKQVRKKKKNHSSLIVMPSSSSESKFSFSYFVGNSLHPYFSTSSNRTSRFSYWENF